MESDPRRIAWLQPENNPLPHSMQAYMPFLRRLIVALLFLALNPTGWATHYKGAQISWERTAIDTSAETVTVEFGIVIVMDRGAFATNPAYPAPDHLPGVSDYVQDPIGSSEIDFGDGSTVLIASHEDIAQHPLVVTAVDFTLALVVLAPIQTPNHTYSYSNIQTWSAHLNCTARDSGLLNLPGTTAVL